MAMTPFYDDPNDPRRRGLYPNGVERQPWDERMPSGQSAMDIGLPKGIQDMLTRQTIAGQQSQRPRQAGPPPPPPPPIAMPEVPDTSQVEPPNNGLNSVGQVLAQYGPHYNYGTAHVSPERGGTMVGTVPGTSRRSHLEALGIADPTSKVEQTPEGWQIDPAHERGKKYGILHGILQGALQGIATTGKWQGALGGAATGGIAGGISPKLLQGLERHQEIGREQTEYNRELGNRENEQKLGLQQSQTIENLAQAEKARRGPRTLKQGDDGVWRSVSEDTGLDTEGNPVQGKDPDAATQYQKDTLAETKRYHDQIVTQRKADRAARIAMARQRAKDKPSPANEASLRAVIEDDAEQNALQRRKETDEKIAKLQGQRDKLTHRSVQNEDGTWGWEEDIGAAMMSKTSVTSLDKQIADLQKESDNQQRIAETAAENKRKAEAKAKAGGQPPQWHSRGGGSDLDHPIYGKPVGGAPVTKGNVSRAKFRAKYPEYKDRSDKDVDTAISNAGYAPIP